MAALALPLMLVGTVVSTVGTIVGGQMQQNAYNYQAAAEQQAAQYKKQQADVAASEARTAGQAQAEERRRNARLALSTIQARVAGGGGDTTDQGIVDLSGKVKGRGEYQALTEMFSGENRARGYEDEGNAAIWQGNVNAGADRYAGDIARTSSYFRAGGTLLSGLGGMANTYAGNVSGFSPYTRGGYGGPLVINQYG